MYNRKLIKFCFFLYKLERKHLVIYLSSLSPNDLFFILSELIRFGFMLAKFRGINLLKSRDFNFYLNRKFFVKDNMIISKCEKMDKKNHIFNFKFKCEMNVDFKKSLLLELLKRDPVVGLYERRAYVKKHGYKNYKVIGENYRGYSYKSLNDEYSVSV